MQTHTATISEVHSSVHMSGRHTIWFIMCEGWKRLVTICIYRGAKQREYVGMQIQLSSEQLLYLHAEKTHLPVASLWINSYIMDWQWQLNVSIQAVWVPAEQQWQQRVWTGCKCDENNSLFTFYSTILIVKQNLSTYKWITKQVEKLPMRKMSRVQYCSLMES